MSRQICKYGITSDDVKYLQESLISLGYSCGSCGADGDFGTATKNAVLSFQVNNKLYADGICGAITWEFIEKALKSKSTESKTTKETTETKTSSNVEYTADKLLEIAIAEIGYHEKETNANLDSKTANSGDGNYTKYARDLHQAGYYGGNLNGYAWCDMFVDWCFYQLAGKNKIIAESLQSQTGCSGASCTASSNYYKQAGMWSTKPQVGAQIFFQSNGSMQHTGIVESYDSSTVYTIEGNSNNQVIRRTYSITSKSIAGYGIPKYTSVTQPKKMTTTVSSVYPTVRQGSNGEYVKLLQTKLIELGYSCGSSGADGDFGNNTLSAVEKFQKDNGLVVDGVCGTNTWNCINSKVSVT